MEFWSKTQEKKLEENSYWLLGEKIFVLTTFGKNVIFILRSNQKISASMIYMYHQWLFRYNMTLYIILYKFLYI